MTMSTRLAVSFSGLEFLKFTPKRIMSANNTTFVVAAGQTVCEEGAGDATEDKQKRNQVRGGWLRVSQQGPCCTSECLLGNCSMHGFLVEYFWRQKMLLCCIPKACIKTTIMLLGIDAGPRYANGA